MGGRPVASRIRTSPVDEGASLRRLLVAARVIHPFPTLLNVGATFALAIIAVDGLPATSTLVRLCAAMFCVQAAIGASNDYFDRDLDARTKPYKPIVRGAIEPRAALAVAGVFGIAAGALSATLGVPSLLLGAVGLSAGLGYNVRLKRSVLSALPFMVALPALPFWVWLSLDAFDASLWWLLPFAPLAGLAVHLSNTLPDLEADRLAGVRGLAHAIGPRASLRLAWGSFAGALALAAVLAPIVADGLALFVAGWALAAALFAAAIAAYAIRPGWLALQLGFGLIGAATACLAAGWLAATA